MHWTGALIVFAIVHSSIVHGNFFCGQTGQNLAQAWNFAEWNEDQLTEQNVKQVQVSIQ